MCIEEILAVFTIKNPDSPVTVIHSITEQSTSNWRKHDKRRRKKRRRRKKGKEEEEEEEEGVGKEGDEEGSALR